MDPKPTKAPADAPEVRARVEEMLHLVRIIALQLKRRLGPATDVDELSSMGREGLLAAARSFDAARGIPFRHWASLRIRGSMIDGMRSQGGLPRRVYQRLRMMESADRVQGALLEEDGAQPPASPEQADARITTHLSAMAMAAAASFAAPLTEGIEEVADRADSPEEAVARGELLALIRTAIAARPDAERKLLERHYFDGVTFDVAAQEIGLSKSWASRLHARAIEAVARELKVVTRPR